MPNKLHLLLPMNEHELADAAYLSGSEADLMEILHHIWLIKKLGASELRFPANLSFFFITNLEEEMGAEWRDEFDDIRVQWTEDNVAVVGQKGFRIPKSLEVVKHTTCEMVLYSDEIHWEALVKDMPGAMETTMLKPFVVEKLLRQLMRE